MQPAQDRLAQDLSALSFQNPFVSGGLQRGCGGGHFRGGCARSADRQVTGTVRWEPSVRLLIDEGRRPVY
jgi:hypothetical protein